MLGAGHPQWLAQPSEEMMVGVWGPALRGGKGQAGDRRRVALTGPAERTGVWSGRGGRQGQFSF